MITITLNSGERISTDNYDILVSYQYGEKENERTEKRLHNFVLSPFYGIWMARSTTYYTAVSHDKNCTLILMAL